MVQLNRRVPSYYRYMIATREIVFFSFTSLFAPFTRIVHTYVPCIPFHCITLRNIALHYIHTVTYIYNNYIVYVYIYSNSSAKVGFCWVRPLHIYIYIHNYIYIYIHVHTHTYIYICVYIFLYLHIQIQRDVNRRFQALQSCHFRPELLSAPLAEAAGRGHLEVSQAPLGPLGGCNGPLGDDEIQWTSWFNSD